MTNKSAVNNFIKDYDNFQTEAGAATLFEVHELVLELARAIRDDLIAIKKGTNDGVH